MPLIGALSTEAGDYLGSPGSQGFNIAPLIPVWNRAFAQLVRGDTPMPTFGTVGASLSGGWTDVASQGLQLLGGWAQSRAAQKAQKQQLKQLRQLARLQQTGITGGGYQLNPLASVTPNLGGTGTPMQYALGLTGVPQAPIVPTIPGWTVEEGTGDLGRAWDWITSLGEGTVAAATPTGAVAVRRASPPRIVGAIDNASGKSAFYRYVGAPILFRGDLTTLKTARKAVSKFGGVTRKGCAPFRRRR